MVANNFYKVMKYFPLLGVLPMMILYDAGIMPKYSGFYLWLYYQIAWVLFIIIAFAIN